MSILPPWFFSRNPPLPSSHQPSLQPHRDQPQQSLHHYAMPGIPPPSSRVDPKLRLQPRQPLRLWDYWKYGFVLATKATELTGDVLSHHIWGPRKKSWGIEMTILTSIFRGAGRHSALVDIGTIRSLMSIGGLVPLPSDALVTPVTFRVRKRSLRGILAQFDAAESGTRELSGEWVVGKKTWQRLQAEWRAAKLANTSDFAKRKERVILYIHGGAYYLSSAAAQRLISIPLSKYTDSRVFALDYRLAPETQFPGPLHDVVCGYLRLVEDLHIPSENIILCGDSAGGGLSLALLMYLRDNNYPMPSGAILLSPWVDLTMSCESWDSNALFDVVPFPTADNHMNPIALYLGEYTEQYLTHPYASPLFGDLKGMPPLLIQAGDAEVLRDEITLLAHKATLAGVEVRHELYEDAIHVFQTYPFLDATRRSFESMRSFIRNVLPQVQTRSPQPFAASAEHELSQEIENEHAVVVGGDGVELNLGTDNVKESFSQAEEVTGSESDEDKASWVRTPAWSATSASSSPIFPFSQKNGNDIEIEAIEDINNIPELSLSEPISPQLEAPQPMFAPRRIQSAVSLLIGGYTSRPQSAHHHYHHSVQSSPKHGGVMFDGLTMSTVVSVPPSPSLRRRQSAESYSDISSLVEQWSITGPANRTTTFKS